MPAAAGGLVSCGADSASGNVPPPSPPKNNGPRSTPVTPVGPVRIERTEPAEGFVRVTGVVLELGARSQQPFQAGTVVAVPQALFESFAASVSGPLAVKVGEGRGFPLTRVFLSEPDVRRAELGRDGTFILDTPPGPYVFCLGNLDIMDNQADPTAVWVDATFPRTITEEDVQAIVPLFDRSTGELTILE